MSVAGGLVQMNLFTGGGHEEKHKMSGAFCSLLIWFLCADVLFALLLNIKHGSVPSL